VLHAGYQYLYLEVECSLCVYTLAKITELMEMPFGEGEEPRIRWGNPTCKPTTDSSVLGGSGITTTLAEENHEGLGAPFANPSPPKNSVSH